MTCGKCTFRKWTLDMCRQVRLVLNFVVKSFLAGVATVRDIFDHTVGIHFRGTVCFFQLLFFRLGLGFRWSLNGGMWRERIEVGHGHSRRKIWSRERIRRRTDHWWRRTNRFGRRSESGSRGGRLKLLLERIGIHCRRRIEILRRCIWRWKLLISIRVNIRWWRDTQRRRGTLKTLICRRHCRITISLLRKIIAIIGSVIRVGNHIATLALVTAGLARIWNIRARLMDIARTF